MSLQLRSSARIPSGSISPFMRMAPLAFLLLFTLPQHLAEGEGAAPAWRRVPDPSGRAIAVSGSQERGKGLFQHPPIILSLPQLPLPQS